MALNTLHNVTLSEAQISIILYTLEDYMSSDRKSNESVSIHFFMFLGGYLYTFDLKQRCYRRSWWEQKCSL